MIYRLLFVLLFTFAIQVSAPTALAQESATAESKTKTEAAVDKADAEPAVAASEEVAEPAEEEHSNHSDADHDEAGHGDEHAHDEEHGAHGGGESAPNPLATDPDLALWTLGVFLITLYVLKSMAWTPIMEGLKAREEGITGNLAAADAKHEEAKALLAEHQAKLASTADEVRALLEEAHRDAEQTRAQGKADGQALADTARDRAVRDIEHARDSAVRQLAESSAGLAIDLAAKVVRQDISSDRQSEIVKEALGRFASGDTRDN